MVIRPYKPIVSYLLSMYSMSVCSTEVRARDGPRVFREQRGGGRGACDQRACLGCAVICTGLGLACAAASSADRFLSRARAGWLIMFRLVLSKIPVVRALCDMRELPKDPSSPGRKHQ